MRPQPPAHGAALRGLRALLVAAALCAPSLAVAQAATPAAPYLWLEDVTGEKALAWVSEAALTVPYLRQVP